jgi:hypothetical protein
MARAQAQLISDLLDVSRIVAAPEFDTFVLGDAPSAC